MGDGARDKSQTMSETALSISNNGTAYRLDGRRDRPVIALVHGLGLTHETWRGHVNALGEHYRVLSYDLYGHGSSAVPPRRPSVSLFAEQLRDLMDELSIMEAAIAGFSLGGMINRRCAMDYPDRVKALVVLNSPHERTPEAQKRVEQQASDTSSGGPGATLDAAIERWFTEQFREEFPDIITEIRGWILANDATIYAQCRQVLAQGVIELIRPEPPIGHPTLVMTCENDTGSTPLMAQGIASEIKRAKLQIVPHLQHMGLMEQPELFYEPTLTFLDTVFAEKP